eukprot:7341350-Prymnesium_polylepis.2
MGSATSAFSLRRHGAFQPAAVAWSAQVMAVQVPAESTCDHIDTETHFKREPFVRSAMRGKGGRLQSAPLQSARCMLAFPCGSPNHAGVPWWARECGGMRSHRVAILDGPAGRGFGIVANLACAVHVRTARRHLLGSVVGIACAPNVAVRGGIGRAPREGIRRCVTLGALEAAVRRHGIVGVAVAIDVAVVRLDVGGHHRCGGVACVHTGRQGEGRLNLHRECLAGANSARRVRVVHAGVAIVHHIVPRDVAPVDVLRPRRASNVNVVRVGVVRHGEEVLHASSATIDRVLPGAVSCVVERHEHLIRAAAAQRRRGATRVAQRRGSSDLAKDGDLL